MEWHTTTTNKCGNLFKIIKELLYYLILYYKEFLTKESVQQFDLFFPFNLFFDFSTTGLLNIICYNFLFIFLLPKFKITSMNFILFIFVFLLCGLHSFSLFPLLCSLPFCILIISLLVALSHFHFLSVSFCLIHNLLLSPLFLVLLFAKRMIILHLSQSVLLSLLPYLATFTLIFICSVLLPHVSNLPPDESAILPDLTLTDKSVYLTPETISSFNTGLIQKNSQREIKGGNKKRFAVPSFDFCTCLCKRTKFREFSEETWHGKSLCKTKPWDLWASRASK